MMNANYNGNPYKQQILDKGRDLPDLARLKRTFPCTIHGRVFETEQEYDEAFFDFMNGN